MELVFQETQLSYLKRILCETVSQEQTADLVVPDALADVERVVDVCATPLVRLQECNGATANVEGVVQTVILFVGMDESLQRVTAQIPFSVRRELSEAYENCTLQCKCDVSSADARMLNSRKILARVGVSCTLSVYAPSQLSCYDLPEAAPNLQLKRREIPLTLAVAVGEKSFALNEELELPNTKPLAERLIKCAYRAQIAEQKIVGDKAVFKGGLLIHALYETVEEKLVSFEWNVPFSQFATLNEELDDGHLQTALCLTAAEIEADVQGNRFLLSAQLSAQCTVYAHRRLTIIDDAFCTDAEFQPRIQPMEAVGILDQQILRGDAIAGLQESVQDVVDAWLYPQETLRERTDAGVRLEVPLHCNVIYYDENGALQGRTLRPFVQVETALCEQGNCNVTNIDCGEAFCDASAGGLRVRVPVALTVNSSALHRYQAVSGGEITPVQKPLDRMPAVLLRRLDDDEELWQIAKACRTPLASILQANGLSDETVRAGTMLLIPM